MTMAEYEEQKKAKLEAQKARAAENAIKAKAAVQAEKDKKVLLFAQDDNPRILAFHEISKQ